MKTKLQAAIAALGLTGRDVCVHASLRSFGVRADGLLDAFLEEDCTVLVPTFSDMFEALPVKEYMPGQNGAGDYSYFYEKEYADAGFYTPDSNRVSVEEMGLFPKMVLEHPDRVRGGNRLNSFAAVGRHAQMLVSGQTDRDVYAPLQKLYEADGYVLLMGVGLDRATAIHYAEQVAGRNPFIRWSKDDRGNTVPVSAGGCSDGFEQLAGILKSYEKTVTVGRSLWRCYRVRDLVDVCVAAIRENPGITHCGNADCSRCNDAILGGPPFNWQ